MLVTTAEFGQEHVAEEQLNKGRVNRNIEFLTVELTHRHVSCPTNLSNANAYESKNSSVSILSQVSRDIGITEGGFVEIPGHSLPVAGSVSITFNSREPDAILMLATDESPTTRRRKRRHTKTV